MSTNVKLFNDTDSSRNWLPCDGAVNYFGIVLNGSVAGETFNQLMHTIAWKNDEVMMFGKKIVTKRKMAWYGDEDVSYTYSKIERKAIAWTKELVMLKQLAEKLSGNIYNGCLLNLYHSGGEAMGWHADNEKDIVANSAIASFSFGAERKFAFKHRQTKQSVSMLLEHGSLLVMKGETQTHWLHRLPPTKSVLSPRINLTFRLMIK